MGQFLCGRFTFFVLRFFVFKPSRHSLSPRCSRTALANLGGAFLNAWLGCQTGLELGDNIRTALRVFFLGAAARLGVYRLPIFGTSFVFPVALPIKRMRRVVFTVGAVILPRR